MLLSDKVSDTPQQLSLTLAFNSYWIWSVKKKSIDQNAWFKILSCYFLTMSVTCKQCSRYATFWQSLWHDPCNYFILDLNWFEFIKKNSNKIKCMLQIIKVLLSNNVRDMPAVQLSLTLAFISYWNWHILDQLKKFQ